MREASGGAEKLVAIEIRLTNSACNTETELTGLETLSTRCVIEASSVETVCNAWKI